MSKKSNLETLKPTVERFHQAIRWKDFQSASRIIVPERRKDFQKARIELNDDKDLSITDYEVVDVKVSADGNQATIQSRIQWMRLPSASERTALVTSEFVFRDGAWQLESQEDGPFEGELPSPTPSPSSSPEETPIP
ncbi:hypothetical protein [Corallococcus macrosporus]|uniref:DUF4440 domain-containing protein n=1 Tax=Myxococcus fulvus (strain ATCC BAA-855 / HW-1) TaxID=483219 RepID=F8CQ82_MYXFH|nr:hypothetical protein [Corallococcus macrosporus]AEI65411.1 hypothetical protein LILAB_17545 [Corallococcus macrosporus]